MSKKDVKIEREKTDYQLDDCPFVRKGDFEWNLIL